MKNISLGDSLDEMLNPVFLGKLELQIIKLLSADFSLDGGKGDNVGHNICIQNGWQY